MSNDVSVSLPPEDRHPLGLPAGSIRAILSLGIAGAFLLYLSHPKSDHVPLYLQLMTFALFLFFASHGRTIGVSGRSPLFLPAGSLRFLLVAVILGVVGWQCYVDLPGVINRLKPTEVEMQKWSLLFACTMGGFFLGWLIARGPWRTASAFQDFLAWSAIVALLMVLGEMLWKGFIDPKAEILNNREVWESVLLGVVAFYFGSRS